MSEELIVPYCTVQWAEQFFSEFVFDANWTDASDAKRISAIKAATNFIDLFVTFYDENEQPVFYTPDGTDDFKDNAVPRLLKQACAQEAAYLLALDDNPAEPHPLTILGMLSADGKKFDTDMTPPIFPKGVAKLLSKLHGEIDSDAVGEERMQVRAMHTTC